MINKRKAIALIKEYGDAILDLNGRSPILVTSDFSTPYIKSIKRTKRFTLKGNVLVFNWTDNEFEAIPIRDITNITPLSKLLKNKGPNDGNEEKVFQR